MKKSQGEPIFLGAQVHKKKTQHSLIEASLALASSWLLSYTLNLYSQATEVPDALILRSLRNLATQSRIVNPRLYDGDCQRLSLLLSLRPGRRQFDTNNDPIDRNTLLFRKTPSLGVLN